MTSWFRSLWTLRLAAWSDIVNSVSAKRLDVLDAAQATKERQKSILFTEPYITQPIVILTRDNVGYVNGLSALAGKTVAYEHGITSA